LKKRLNLDIFKEVENTFSHKMKVHGIGIMHSQNPQVALSFSRSGGGSLERLKLVKMK
jgi:hypothetical protein